MSRPVFQHFWYPLQPPDASSIPLAPGQQLGLWQNVNPATISPAPGVPYYASTYTLVFRPGLLPNAPGIFNSMAQGIPSFTLVEEPKNIVYVGRIASTVENNFVLALLGLCGHVKSWKRREEPGSFKYKTFGLCEFANAEGVLRALRLLNKLNIDGQELMLKTDNKFDTANYGLVSDEDKKIDQETMEKLKEMVKLRLKRNISLPPPLPAVDGQNSSNWQKVAQSEGGARRRRRSTYKEKLERSLADEERKIERKIRLRGIALENYERIIEKERAKRERICKYQDKIDEGGYRRQVKIREDTEKLYEHKRKVEEDMDKEMEHFRAQKILNKEKGSDSADSKRPKYKNRLVDNRRRREKECDLEDRIKKEEEAELEEGEIVEESYIGDHHHTESGDDFEFVARSMYASDIQVTKLGCEEEETPYIQKHFDSIDQIPKSKEELFSHKINKDVCDKDCVGSSANAAKSIPDRVMSQELGAMDNLNLLRPRLCFCFGNSFICKYCAQAMDGKK